MGPAAQSGIKASDEVFRDDMLQTYELTFADADWNQLQQTATEEQYVPAMLSVNGEPVGKIGVRYKGATGTLQGCFTDGVLTCRKLSMKLKFDEYEPELRYRGLKKLNLHGSLNDPSHLHERLTYQLFREFDVLAPRSVHARVLINGEYKGLYNLTEEVDGRFTDHRFQGADGQGTLYKEAWPAKSQDPGYYSNAQQTNEGSPVDKVVQFAGELANAADDQLGTVVSRWMDPAETLRYLAVHTTAKHWDGPLTFYCTAEYGCNNHNFLIYEAVTQNRFSIVAWDTDNTFYEDVLTDQALVPSWYEPPPECNFDAVDGFLPPGCDRLVQGFVQLGLDKFGDTLAKFLEGPYKVSELQADVDRWAAQIDESVKTDPAGSGYEDWRGNVEFLKGMIQKRGDRAVMLRDSF
jgi:spore coat protein CotH